MKGVRCSWVDMQKVRQALSAGERGDQKALERIRCVGKATVSDWQAAAEVMDATDGKVRISELSSFQPSHASVIARHFRRQAEEWTEEIKDEIAGWVERCEAEEWTVRQLKDELSSSRGLKAELLEVPEGEPAPELHCCPMQELLPKLSGVDAIITDPPYPEEFLPLYGELARLAKSALAPAGVLAVMCGQLYLPRILPDMAAHMPYRWTMAYLTPGGQSPQIWPKKVNTFWKPVLLFGEAERWLGDVVKSDVNDNDKTVHHWGQSESGMARLVEVLTTPGQLVCDPFLGSGTTAVVCQRLGRRFVGCDIDPRRMAQARGA